jgi:GNAT superfamily N-acetyltransferase
MEQTFLEDAVTFFGQNKSVWLVWSVSDDLIPPDPDCALKVNRIAFTVIDPLSDVLVRWRERLPEGFDIQPIDRQTFKQCEWRDEMIYYCGSERNFFQNGMGFCIKQGTTIVAESYASSLGKSYAEIGVITRENYRGMGLAPILCAYLIDECRRRGFLPYWSCDADNVPSIRVAQKLGFSESKKYNIYEYSFANQ